MSIHDPYVQFIRGQMKRVKGKAVSGAMSRLTDEDILRDVKQLEEEIRPTMIDQLIRFALWRKLHSSEQEIEPKEIYGPICTYTHWFVNFLNNRKKLAWILNPVKAGRNSK